MDTSSVMNSSLASGKYPPPPPYRRPHIGSGFRAFVIWLWPILLQMTALLDLLATIINRRLRKDDACRSTNGHHEEEQVCLLRLFSTDYNLRAYPVFMTNAILWLDINSLYIGLAFSLAWCIQAFVIATHNAERALVENKRRFIMNYLARVLRSKKNQGASSLESNNIDDHDNSDDENQDNTDEDEAIELHRFKIYFVFYTSLILQFLCLPVGFYLIVYQFGRSAMSNTHKYLNFGGTLLPHSPQEMRYLLESTYQLHLPDEYRSFSNETKLALGFAVAKHMGNSVHKMVGVQLRVLWKKLWMYGFKLGFKAVRHPRITFGHSRNLLSVIRWIKYLRPLLAGVLNLVNNFRGIVKMYHQRRQRKLAKKVRQLLWTKLTPEQRRRQAAQKIQSTWRSYRQRQNSYVWLLSKWEMEEVAARKMQAVLRSSLKRRRAKRERQVSELRHLQDRRSSLSRVSNDLKVVTYQPQSEEESLEWSRSQQARLEELQDELESRTSSKTLDERLLMKPNTRFQIIWKSLFVFVTCMEVAARVLNPRLAQYTSKITGEPLSLSSQIKEYFLVMPIEKLPQCSCIKRTKLNAQGKRKRLSKAKPSPTSSETLKVWMHSCSHSPWYCHPMYYLAQARYNRLVHLIIDEAYAIMSAIAFLDVPVTFYTGRYCPETGVLLSKPFLQRWIAPGLLLTLLVNPRIRPVSRFLLEVAKRSFQVGPIRAWRWIRVFYPVVLAFLDMVEYKIWIPLVRYANLHSRRYVPPPTVYGLPLSPTSATRQSLTISSLRRSSASSPGW